jgi:hypothetical protein
VIWRLWEDERSPWGTVHDSGISSRGDRRWEAIQVVTGDDLRVVEVRVTRTTLLEMLGNRGLAGGRLPLVRHRGGGSRAARWLGMVLGLALARLDSRRMAPVARGRGARPGCSSVWHGGAEAVLHSTVARREAVSRGRKEEKAKPAFALTRSCARGYGLHGGAHEQHQPPSGKDDTVGTAMVALVGFRQACGRKKFGRVGLVGHIGGSLGRFQAGWAALLRGPGSVTSFKLNIRFSNYFHCSEFENTKQILPDVQKIPNLARC